MYGTLYVHVRTACPSDMRVMIAPFAVRTAFDSAVQPDVLVTPYVDLTSKNLPVALLLAVEALSRSTRLEDRILEPGEPGELTAFELDADGRYRQVAQVEGDVEFTTTRPFPITVVPAYRLDGLQPG